VVFPLIPVILIAGTAASLAIQGAAEASRPEIVIQKPQPKEIEKEFSIENNIPLLLIAAFIIFLILVML